MKKPIKKQAVKLANAKARLAKAKTEVAVTLHNDRVAAKAPVIIEVVPPMSNKSVAAAVMSVLKGGSIDAAVAIATAPSKNSIHEMLVTAGLSESVVTQPNDTHTYSHTDGRTALRVGIDKWVVNVNGEQHHGTSKTLQALNTALSLPQVSKERTLPAPNVLRAIEILGGLTDNTYALDSLKGDKGYKHRVTLLKKLFQTDKVLVKDAALPNLIAAFHTALGITNNRTADAKAVDFAQRCKEATTKAAKAIKDAAKELEAKKKSYLLVTEKERAIKDGKPMLPAYKKKTKKEREAEKAQLIEDAALLKTSPEQPAVPRPDAEVNIVGADVQLLEDPNNGLVMMQIERANSQGAICVYNNGKRVAVGVVPPETLNILRPINGADLVKAANQLLSPITPGVPVTPTAARHLTAVLHCKELTPMANTKKFAPPANTAKKAVKETKAVKPAKAAKAAKPAKEKKESTGRTALYRLLNDAKTKWTAFKGQKAVVVDALVKAGAVGKTGAGITSSALYAKLDGKLETNSTVERIAGFYLSTWQKEGIIEKYEPAA